MENENAICKFKNSKKSTVITVDELEASQWAIGGVTLDEDISKKEIVVFVNIKVSKGTTNPKEK